MRQVERRWGLVLGVLLFIAFWLQIEGLARTSSNRNAFVTGLNVLVVPILAMLVLGRRYGLALWAACGMALLGMTLMFHEDNRSPAPCSTPSTSSCWKKAHAVRPQCPCAPRAWPPLRPR